MIRVAVFGVGVIYLLFGLIKALTVEQMTFVLFEHQINEVFKQSLPIMSDDREIIIKAVSSRINNQDERVELEVEYLSNRYSTSKLDKVFVAGTLKEIEHQIFLRDFEMIHNNTLHYGDATFSDLELQVITHESREKVLRMIEKIGVENAIVLPDLDKNSVITLNGALYTDSYISLDVDTYYE